MNKQATKGDVIFWSMLILFELSEGYSKIFFGLFVGVVWVHNTWFSKEQPK